MYCYHCARDNKISIIGIITGNNSWSTVDYRFLNETHTTDQYRLSSICGQIKITLQYTNDLVHLILKRPFKIICNPSGKSQRMFMI